MLLRFRHFGYWSYSFLRASHGGFPVHALWLLFVTSLVLAAWWFHAWPKCPTKWCGVVFVKIVWRFGSAKPKPPLDRVEGEPTWALFDRVSNKDTEIIQKTCQRQLRPSPREKRGINVLKVRAFGPADTPGVSTRKTWASNRIIVTSWLRGVQHGEWISSQHYRIWLQSRSHRPNLRRLQSGSVLW